MSNIHVSIAVVYVTYKYCTRWIQPRRISLAAIFPSCTVHTPICTLFDCTPLYPNLNQNILTTRANGEQTYSIGWARYEGKGPSTASELGTLDGNTTVEADFGLGGVAGSSIPQKDWLASIDGASAALGSLTAIGHLLGCVFHSLVLFAFLRLFQSQFRSNRLLFRPASKASGALLVWLVGFGGAGFYSTAEENFKEQILSTLHGEGFLCEVCILHVLHNNG